MKRQTIALLVVAVFGSGCATIDKVGQPPVSVIATTNPGISGKPVANEAVTPTSRLNSTQSLQKLTPTPAIPADEQPFAVIKIDPGTGKLTGEMELRLQKVVEEAKLDERTFLRVESFVPASGSPGFDLSNSEKYLQIVKDRLVGSGISQRRILVSSFGAEHDLQRDPTRHWVEIHLIRTGTSSIPMSSGTRK
jgi:outer membrane protein OmpA-like peptidoglycan-associated protein